MIWRARSARAHRRTPPEVAYIRRRTCTGISGVMPCLSLIRAKSLPGSTPQAPGHAVARNSITCQTKCPGRLLQRGWAPQERRSLAWATRWQGSIRHDDRRSRARWNVDGDHKSSIWFSTTDGARELVCAYVALSGNHCELRKRRLWKLLARAHAVIEGNGRVFILVQLRAADQQLSSSGSRRRQSRPKSFAYAGC